VITDIVKSDTLGTCPQGYNYLFEYDFKATDNACSCLDKSGINNYFNGSCSNDQRSAGCSIANHIPETKMRNWYFLNTTTYFNTTTNKNMTTNTSEYYTLCAKRLNDNNFMSISTQCTSN